MEKERDCNLVNPNGLIADVALPVLLLHVPAFFGKINTPLCFTQE